MSERESESDQPLQPDEPAEGSEREESGDERSEAAEPAPFALQPPAPEEPVGASADHDDPWAHRRGEPRLFAFLWTLYLLAAVVGSVIWLAGSTALQPDAYGPSARIMLVAVAVGMTVLWPMTRLCQVVPDHPLRACVADTVVIVAPVQMIVWPLAFLASWPLDVIAGTAALLGAWGVMAGGLLANALQDQHAPRGLTRAGWMAGIIGVVFAGQLLAAFGVATARPWLANLSGLSPFAGVYEISGHGIVGAERPVTVWQWWLIASVAAGALLTWLVALLRAWRTVRGAP